MSASIRHSYLFDPEKGANYYLPKLLNKLGVGLENFKKLAIADQPELVQGLLFAVCKFEKREDFLLYKHDRVAAKAALRRVLHERRLNDRPVQPNEVSRRLCRRTSHGDNPYWPVNAERAMQGLVADIVRKAELYEKDGVVHSGILSRFSYDSYEDYRYQISRHREIRCPHCGHSETVLGEDEWTPGIEDDVEPLADASDEFTHVTGPYCRCESCDSVIRLEVDEADNLPAHHESDGVEWDDYKDSLEYGLVELRAKLVEAGLPAPDKLELFNGNMDWQRRSGHATCGYDADDLAKTMSVNSEFSVTAGRFLFVPAGANYRDSMTTQPLAEMSCVLSHHDVPTGGAITARPMWETEDDSDELLSVEGVLDSRNRLAPLVQTLCCGSHNLFEYTENGTFGPMSEEQAFDSLRELASRLERRVADSDNLLQETAAEAIALLIRCLAGDSLPAPGHVRELVDNFINETE